MSNKTIQLIIDCVPPTLTTGLADAIRRSIENDKNLIDKIERINIKIYAEERKPEIDWSMVPAGTKVLPSDKKENLDADGLAVGLFQGYFPLTDYPFWVFDNGRKDAATGYKHCKLAEPMKPEWEKK